MRRPRGVLARVPGGDALASLETASARSALAWRTRRELHDEVGQTLTGVMLQVEGLAAAIPEGLREQLEVLRETARHGTQEVRRIARRLRPEPHHASICN